MEVPCNYGPKEKFLARLLSDPDLKRPAMVLPRIAFEITSIQYDSSRKLITTNKVVRNNPKGGTSTLYSPVPYNFNFNLYVMTKNIEDGTRIIEQILPYFTPTYTVTVKVVPQLNITHDVPITLNSVENMDSYDGSYEERRAIIWTLGFTLQGWLYGPTTNNVTNIIKKVTINFFAPTTNTAIEGIGITSVSEGFIMTPGQDANGNPTQNSSIAINYKDVQPDTPYAFIYDFFSND
jgi:hypothetical protein